MPRAVTDGTGNLIQQIVYTIGHDHISQSLVRAENVSPLIETTVFHIDGHGNMRILTDLAGSIVTLAGLLQRGSTGCCASGEPQAKEVMVNTFEVLIAAPVIVRGESSTWAVQSQSGVVNAHTRVNHHPGRTGPRVASNPGYPAVISPPSFSFASVCVSP